MTVEQACGVFEHFPRISGKLNTMRDVGLGYIKIGQPATTLSGGEAQRVKLSTELSRRATGRTVYILDEPTTGLSFEDAAALLKVLQRLVDTGNSVILIEHHLDLIKSADYLIDLGPKAGDEGGYIVAVGTPEEIAAVPESYTGQYLSQSSSSANPNPSPQARPLPTPLRHSSPREPEFIPRRRGEGIPRGGAAHPEQCRRVERGVALHYQSVVVILTPKRGRLHCHSEAPRGI